MTDTILLRISIIHPPAGVTWTVQSGRRDLIAPRRCATGSIIFDISARLGKPRPNGTPNLLGDITQGPPDGRFIYVNSGQLAGQLDSCWERRAKVSLRGISREMIDDVLGTPGARLAVHIAGTARDSGPACATVPLLDGGWRVAGLGEGDEPGGGAE